MSLFIGSSNLLIPLTSVFGFVKCQMQAEWAFKQNRGLLVHHAWLAVQEYNGFDGTLPAILLEINITNFIIYVFIT